MKTHSHLFWITLALGSLFSLGAHAKLDIAKDCRDLIAHFHIPASETSAFRSWCEQFESSCYSIEAASARACGGNGSQEAQGRKLMADAGTQLNGNTSFQVGTAAGIEAIESAIIMRKFQMQLCTGNLKKCTDAKATFSQSSLPTKPTLTCTLFTPESDEWSPIGKSAGDMCLAIQAEIERVQAEVQVAESQKQSMQGLAGTTSGGITPEGIKPGDRACGLFGCEQNADGTYVARPAPAASGTSSPAASPPEQDYRRAPTANYELRLPTNDARACGIFGCEQNDDGTFSPKYAPKQ